jgi:hypothetical protein
MNLIEFTNNLKNPSSTSVEQTAELKYILEEYPYFQAAHFLYLNGLKNQNSFKYNKALKTTAAYTSDRSVLFDFITSYDFNYHPAVADIVPVDELLDINDLETVETELETHSTTLPVGKPLQFSSSETHSFNEWLQITSVKPIKRDLKVPVDEQDFNKPKQSRRNMDLIESFIALKPKIKPTVSGVNIDIAIESITENESLMTETLAHVYLEQKKYKKAITAFTVLSLKYPEKSSFFANQIQAIKKLQEK